MSLVGIAKQRWRRPPLNPDDLTQLDLPPDGENAMRAPGQDAQLCCCGWPQAGLTHYPTLSCRGTALLRWPAGDVSSR